MLQGLNQLLQAELGRWLHLQGLSWRRRIQRQEGQPLHRISGFPAIDENIYNCHSAKNEPGALRRQAVLRRRNLPLVEQHNCPSQIYCTKQKHEYA